MSSRYSDPLFRRRNILQPNEVLDSRTCYSGYEGAVNEEDKFTSCHLIIFEPSSAFVRNTIPITIFVSIAILIVA